MQSVGLLIQRLRVRVPLGALLFAPFTFLTVNLVSSFGSPLPFYLLSQACTIIMANACPSIRGLIPRWQQTKFLLLVSDICCRLVHALSDAYVYRQMYLMFEAFSCSFAILGVPPSAMTIFVRKYVVCSDMTCIFVSTCN